MAGGGDAGGQVGGPPAERERMDLLDTELVLLDGRCRPEIQARVDQAKARLASIAANPELPEPVAKFLADARNEAENTGKLVWRHIRLRSCSVCKKQAGYAKYTRYGRYHKKGDDNHDRPLTFAGYELADRSVTIRNYATLGCCHECWMRIQPELARTLSDVRAEIAEQITGRPPTLIRYKNRQCTKCGWTGHEGEMRKLPTLMGDGYYAGGCPKCQAESTLFGNDIKLIDGYTVVPTSIKFAPPNKRDLPKAKPRPETLNEEPF